MGPQKALRTILYWRYGGFVAKFCVKYLAILICFYFHPIGPHIIWGLTGYIVNRFVRDIIERYDVVFDDGNRA